MADKKDAKKDDKPKEADAKDDKLKVVVKKASPEEAAKLLEPALVEDADAAADTFGHIRYRGLAERAAKRLADAGAEEEGARTIDTLIDTLEARSVKPTVVAELKATREAIVTESKTTA